MAIPPSFPLSILAKFLCPPLPAPGCGKHSGIVSGAASTHVAIMSVPFPSPPTIAGKIPQRLPFPGSYTVSGFQCPLNPVLPNSKGVISSLFCAGPWRRQSNTLSSESTLPHILYHCCALTGLLHQPFFMEGRQAALCSSELIIPSFLLWMFKRQGEKPFLFKVLKISSMRHFFKILTWTCFCLPTLIR